MKRFSALLLCISSVTSENVQLRGSENGKNLFSKVPTNVNSPIRMKGKGRARGRSIEGKKVGRKNQLNFVLGKKQDCLVEVVSNFDDRELTIARIGEDKSNIIDDVDRLFLTEMVGKMADEQGDSWEADTVMAQIERVSGLLMDWPPGLDLDYEYDKAADKARDKERAKEDKARPVPADSPEPPENADLPPDRHLGEEEEESPHGRRLIRELCGSLNTFVQSTHDDFDFGRNHDRTTFFAYVSNHPSCGNGDADTWFWDNGWRCFNPDHDPDIEFAVGNCFGRCGAGCGNNGRGTYTRDCLDHDNCVRFGHFIASPFCNDEFLATADDTIFGQRCI